MKVYGFLLGALTPPSPCPPYAPAGLASTYNSATLPVQYQNTGYQLLHSLPRITHSKCFDARRNQSATPGRSDITMTHKKTCSLIPA
ncbi:hypothetical protein NQZ68_019882 [Dissostichus eleginoides]|nr:hypothetical protein NQZ68_019882 [Dissostichus eleginoides]